MDWGKGILLTIIGFVALIMTLVVISVRMDGIELVTENYYEEEIKYQDRINQTNQASSLNKEIISYDAQNKSVQLDLPTGSEAVLHLFRPSDSSLDQELAVSVTEIGKTSVSLTQLKSGYWRVKLSWNVDGVDYYEEKKITI
ncbi:FixH family protein [Algoriphagus aquimarinus]|uniref:FixH family protein n=1 Tax=Algoriphagus aquimarinus TaxID=237018 RepID=UPI0030DD72C5|tara:strand:- start:5703 stop:6128 length:426 start_codon:yes stop_codon:yes gene_type:complete